MAQSYTSEFSKFSLHFVQHIIAWHSEPQLSTGFDENKNGIFFKGKKTPEFEKFSTKLPEKILHFLALIGNTAFRHRQGGQGGHALPRFSHTLSSLLNLLNFKNLLIFCS